MAHKLTDGDYTKQNGKSVDITYIEELLQNAFVAINTRRKRFYPNKNFGSYIKENALTPAEEYAFAYASQAVDGIDGVYVKGAELKDGKIKIKLILNNKEGEVSVKFENV